MRLPEKFEDRMKKMLGDEYDDFIKSMDETPIFTGIRINISKVGAKDAVIKEFGELQNVSWCSDGFYADKSKISGNHPYHLAGLFYFQEPSAMSTVSALNIESDDYVLDLCAAPGGSLVSSWDLSIYRLPGVFAVRGGGGTAVFCLLPPHESNADP